MTHIIYQNYDKRFGEIEIGEFFAGVRGLYLKIDTKRGFCFSYNEIVNFNTWDAVTEVEATITAKF